MRTYLRWQDVNPTELRGHAAVVIDVLRWSTVVVTALTNGAEWVDAVATPDDARSHAATLGRAGIVLGGERGNVALPGFDAGNSPLEYTADRVQGLGVVTTTTNGTQGLLAAREADAVIVGAFVNLPAVLRALEGERLAGRPVALIACGQEGEQALEDVACAGAIATALGGIVIDVATERACAEWARAGRDPRTVMEQAPHAATLRAAGFGADLEFAARVGAFDTVPRRASANRLRAS